MSSYDPPHRPWRRRSRDGSRKSWLASHHPRSRRQQQRKRPPRRPPQSRQLRLPPPSMLPLRHLSRPDRRRLPHRRHRRRLWHQRHRRRPPHRHPRQRNRQLCRGRRQFLVQAYRAPLARLRPPLGSAKDPLLLRGHGLVPPEDSLALPVGVVQAPHGLATTRSPRRREWVRRAHHVPGRMAPDLAHRVHLERVRQVRVLARAYRACHVRTRR